MGKSKFHPLPIYNSTYGDISSQTHVHFSISISICILGSIFESDMLNSYHRFSSHDIITWIDPYSEPSQFYSETQLSCFFDRYLLNKYRECIIALQGLDLTPEEQALLQSYAIANASKLIVSISP